MAGYAYTARFESVLDVIERDRYQLRPVYPERSGLRDQLRISRFVLSMLINELTGGA
jgi:hypothetical protein